MQPNNDSLVSCLDFLHSAQKERGLATLFLCSRGKQGGEELTRQFAETDSAAAIMQERMPATGLNCDPLLRSIQALPSLRQNITAQHVWAFDVIEQYTQALVTPAICLANDLVIRNPRHAPARASALIYLLHWQERLAREREMVSQLAGQEWMHDDAFVSRLKHIIRERQAYERMFWGTVGEEQRQTFAPLKTAMAEGRAAAMKADKQAGKFSFFNARIEALYETALKMANQLAGDSSAAEMPPSGLALDSDIEAQFDSISSLPAFRGLNKDVLMELLRQAHIVHHDKGSVFVVHGEIGERFFIILDGWVKIYKSTAEGDESILQILGRREIIQEHDVLQLVASPVNAKAITKVRLLAIPSPVIRDFAATHKNLALNLLAAASRRSQKLISHLEQLTLRSAEQRVGYFLLNLNLETGIGGPSLVLPFDKSLIASYLGIKPETFSRILREFRARAFIVERNHISLPEPYALCDYCDGETAQKCDLAESGSCPRTEMREVKTG